MVQTPAAPFGPMLRKWRTSRGFSQERLANEAEVSTRHLSFLETGRSAPSREMVLLLTSALDLPLRERNTMLGAAGFASVYRESTLDGPDLAEVRRALDFVLAQQEPYPAIVVDRTWNMLRANEGARRLLSFVVGMEIPMPLPAINAMHAIFAPGPVRDAIVNWEDIASSLVARLQHEVLADADDAEKAALLRACLDQPDVPQRVREPAPTNLMPFVPVTLKVGDVRLSFFTMITSLGTPLDVTAQETRIETYFPADDATERWAKSAP